MLTFVHNSCSNPPIYLELPVNVANGICDLPASEASREKLRKVMWRRWTCPGVMDRAITALVVGLTVAVAAPSILPWGFTETTEAAGFNYPTVMAFLPDGQILVAEKGGVVKVVKNGLVLPMPPLDISSKVNSYWDRGLISVLPDLDFANNGYIYLYYPVREQCRRPARAQNRMNLSAHRRRGQRLAVDGDYYSG